MALTGFVVVLVLDNWFGTGLLNHYIILYSNYNLFTSICYLLNKSTNSMAHLSTVSICILKPFFLWGPGQHSNWGHGVFRPMWRWRWCVTQSEQCLGGELGRWKMVEMGSEKHSYHHIISFPSWIWIWRDIAMFIRSFPVLRCLFSVLGGVAGVAWLGHRKSPLREREISSKSYIFRAS